MANIAVEYEKVAKPGTCITTGSVVDEGALNGSIVDWGASNG